MSKIDKLIKRLLSMPKDFTFDELEKVLNYYGFLRDNKGKTSGSRVEFYNDNISIKLHIPHPSKVLKTYQIRRIILALKREGLL